MSHQTFAIITCRVNSEDQFLLLKNEAGESHFFMWLDRAINGAHRWKYFDKYFWEFFEIPEEVYKTFRRELIPMDKSDDNKEQAKALAKIAVPVSFYESTRKDENQFLWVSSSSMKELLKKESQLEEQQKWIVQYLFQDPLDFVELPTSLFETLKKIQEAREKNKLVIFAGAGISVDSGAPLWWETGAAILASLGLPENTNAEAPLIGQWLFNERGEKEYNDKLREVLHYHKNLQPNPIHRQLLRLRPRHLITTNYDDLLEKALEEQRQSAAGLPYTVIRRDQDLPYAVTDEYILKMHGDWDEMNFVFKEDDYLNYSSNFPLIESFVKGIFSSHLVLFVGFSFSDPNLKQIVNWAKGILGKDFQPAYLFQVESPKSHETTYFREKGIKPVVFQKSITNYLKRMGDENGAAVMSARGCKTYNFLSLLEVFNLHDYRRLKKAKSQHVVDQMYESLYQFDAFNCVPPYSFEKLFPFSLTSLNPAKVPMDAEHNSGYHLQTNNEEIIDLMEGLEFKDNQILLKQGIVGKKAIEQVADFENKLEYVFDKLRSSQIHCIQRKGDPENHNRILFGTQFDEKLLFSQWLNYQYKPMFEFFHSRGWEAAHQPSRLLRERLLDALVLTRFEFFMDAYALYSTIGSEALQRQDYPTFFICQYNKKYLGFRVLRMASWKKYPAGTVRQIKDELDTVDLHGLLKTMQSETDVKELLGDLLDKELFGRYSRAIKRAYNGVLKYYKFFQNPRNESSGSDDASILVENYMTLHWVFHSNGILFGWDEYQFVELTELVFEGLVASICTSERNKGRLKEVDITLLGLACHFLETKKIEKILNHYKPEKLPVKSEGQIKRFVIMATDWFSSCFDENIFLFEPKKNDHLSRYLEDKIYTSEIERLSDNLFLLFSKIDLTELQGSKALSHLFDAILKALTVNSGCRSNRLWEVKYFLHFLEKNIKFLSQAQIEWAFKAITKSHGWKYGFGSALANFLRADDIDFQLTHKPILTEFLAEVRNEKREVEEFVHLYPFLSDELRTMLDDIVRELPKNNDPENLMLWMLARDNGMFPESKELSKTQLEALWNFFAAIEKIDFEKDGTPKNYRYNIAVNGPYWLAMLHYKPEVGLGKKTVQKLLKLKSLPNALRWMLDPKGFDYKNFNPYWVFFFDGEEVLSRIGKMKIPAQRKAFQKELKREFSPKLAEVYYAWFSVG